MSPTLALGILAMLGGAGAMLLGIVSAQNAMDAPKGHRTSPNVLAGVSLAVAVWLLTTGALLIGAAQ